ncbi:MAG TPA: DUF4199 domain-containing protein [Terriglobales bacterium]|nr:DUF4199 domain-containing protein [Terriglobales bacterium]
MKKTVLTFGLISGVISSVLMACNMALIGKTGFDKATYLGYTALVLSFLLVFFGIKSYRDNVGGGQVSFGKAFQVGILITLLSSAMYVAAWEVVYDTNRSAMTDFLDKYNAHILEKEKAAGASEAVLQQKRAEMAKTKEMYQNPVIRAGWTFLEPFPVGLVITLVSAGLLRRQQRR